MSNKNRVFNNTQNGDGQSPLPPAPTHENGHVNPGTDNLESLNGLIAMAKKYAHYSMCEIGRVPVTLFLSSADGPNRFAMATLHTVHTDNDDFIEIIRAICLAHAAKKCALVAPISSKYANPSGMHSLIVLVGESHIGQKQVWLSVICDNNGAFFDLGDVGMPPSYETGRFAALLPPSVPDQETRRCAQERLNLEGIACTQI